MPRKKVSATPSVYPKPDADLDAWANAIDPEPVAVARPAPDVSVLLPVYQLGVYAKPEQAKDSALAQEGVTVEVVACDDGMSDGGDAVLRQWAAADSRVVVCRCDRRERGDENPHNYAPQVAAEHATGRYLIWGNLRAWYEPGAFRDMVAALDERQDIGFVYGWTRFYNGRTDTHRPGPFRAGDFMSHFPSLQGYMYRREALAGGAMYRSYFDYLYPADRDFVMQLIFKLGYAGLALDRLVYHYILSADSMTSVSARHAGCKQVWAEHWPGSAY